MTEKTRKHQSWSLREVVIHTEGRGTGGGHQVIKVERRTGEGGEGGRSRTDASSVEGFF